MGKKGATRSAGTLLLGPNLFVRPQQTQIVRSRTTDREEGHFFEGSCSPLGDFVYTPRGGPVPIIAPHSYYSSNSLGEWDFSAEEVMDLVKANVETLFPGSASCDANPITMGTTCRLTWAGFNVHVVDMTPTSFTFETGWYHPFKGTARHIISKKGRILYLEQEGVGGDWFLSCRNNVEAEKMWREMAENIKILLAREVTRRRN